MGFVERIFNVVENFNLFVAKTTADDFADLVGNCSVTLLDITRTGLVYRAMYSQLSVAQAIESVSLNTISKVLEFRNNGFYLEHYARQENWPGIISILIKLCREALLFKNLYYGKNVVLKQTEQTSPLVMASRPEAT